MRRIKFQSTLNNILIHLFFLSFIIANIFLCSECENIIEEFYLIQGMIKANEGEYDNAIHIFTKAIEINPIFADAYNNRGLAYSDKGQFDHAIKDYTKAIEINPNFANCTVNLSSLFL